MKTAIAIAAWICLCLVPAPVPEARLGGHERRVTLYIDGGDCDDPAGWYEVDSDRSHVTVACYTEDEDPQPSTAPSSDDTDPPSSVATR